MIQKFFQTAPQNPYIFAGLVLLAIISAWQPLARTSRVIIRFIVDAFKKGIRETVYRSIRHTETESTKIIDDPQFGTLNLVANSSRSISMALHTIFLFILGFLFRSFAKQPDAIYQFNADIASRICLAVALINSMLWTFFDSRQDLIVKSVRRKLKAKGESESA